LGVVGPGEFLSQGWQPQPWPVLALRTGEDVVVLPETPCMEKCASQSSWCRPYCGSGDERAAGAVAVDDDFEGVVMQAGVGEVPVVVVSLVKEVEAIGGL